MLVSTCALVFPMADIASLVGPDGTTASEGIPLAALIASILVVIMGILGIVIGYLQAIHDYGNKYLTGFFLVFVQLAWMVRSQRGGGERGLKHQFNRFASPAAFLLVPYLCHRHTLPTWSPLEEEPAAVPPSSRLNTIPPPLMSSL